MTHNFTPNDLLRFLYRETSPAEDSSIKKWITEDAAAAQLFQKLADTSNALDMAEMEPSESSINIILDFSKETAHEESHA
ncbi:MAG: hypothetical protein IPO83_00100 [Chitinophagaceae bacterium]|nr:hypothetical protein [Chitinophagaceae bacterium]